MRFQYHFASTSLDLFKRWKLREEIHGKINSKMDPSAFRGMEDYGYVVSFGSTKSFWGSNNMTPSDDQQDLNSCVTFAVGSILSALVAREFRISPPRFSKQELVDCIPISLEGTSYAFGYGYVNGRGLHIETDYPYVNGYNYPCRCLELRGRSKFSFRDYDFVYDHLEAISLLGDQPLTALMQVYDSFGKYYPWTKPSEDPRKAIYRPYPDERPILDNNRSPLFHAVLVIGYGLWNGEEAFIIKNWSGLKWGFNGYARVAAHLLLCFGYPKGVSMTRL